MLDRKAVLINCLENLLLIGFLVSLPFSIRKVITFFPPFGFTGSFNEYTDISIFLSDILLAAFVLILIINNKEVLLSIKYNRVQMFHVEHFMYFILPLPFILWAGLSTLWAESFVLGWYAWVKLIEGYLLYLALILWIVPRGTINPSIQNQKMFHVEHSEKLENKENVPRGTFLWISRINSWIEKCSTWNKWHLICVSTLVLGTFHALIGIFQVVNQRSLGMDFLKESIFSPNQEGVATVIITGNELVRAYGVFPHPNILGGYLGATLLITLVYTLLFHNKMLHMKHRWIIRTSLFIQASGLLLTFSKSAIFAFVISMGYIFYKMFHVEHSGELEKRDNVPRGTLSLNNSSSEKSDQIVERKYIFQMFHVEHVLVLIGAILIYGFYKAINGYYFFIQPLKERLVPLEALKNILSHDLLTGIGLGQFVFQMQLFIERDLWDWEYQPIHNIYLGLIAEVGIVGFALFLFTILYLFVKNVPRGTFHRPLIQGILMYVLIIGIFDHYTLDIQQGQFLFWFLISLVASIIIIDKSSKVLHNYK